MNQSTSTKLFVLTSCLAVAGCYKEYSENFAEEETIVQNAAIGQQMADDALDIVYQAEVLQKNFSGGSTTFPGSTAACGTITNDAANKILTIDYGSGCADANGRTHSGKIIVNYSSILGDTQADRLVAFDQYVGNLNKVEGTVGLHDFAILPDSAYAAVRTLTDFKITYPNGTGVTFNGSHDRVWTSGRADSLINNNRYTFRESITGPITGMSSTGRSFTQTITTPFIADFYCVSKGFFGRTYGVVELSRLGGYPDRKRTVDYGSDSTKYDNTVTVSTFRRTYGVTTE